MNGWQKKNLMMPDTDHVDGRASHAMRRRSVLPIAAVASTGGRLHVLGMAVGYLGLVTILSMAPYWHVASAPHQNQIMACTDFGGSR